ncbi:MAG: hypothetical protein ABIJ27_03790 [Candidatus Omnitrophota bacterium]
MKRLWGSDTKLIICFAALFVFAAPSSFSAQKDNPLTEYQAVNLTIDSAESLASAQKYQEALQKYQEAMEKLRMIQGEYPGSEVSMMVALKLEKCQRRMDQIAALVRESEQDQKHLKERDALNATITRQKEQSAVLDKELREVIAVSEKEMNNIRREIDAIKDRSSEQISLLNGKIESAKIENIELKKKVNSEIERSKMLTDRIEQLKRASEEQLNSARLEAEEALRRERENAAAMDAENKKLGKERASFENEKIELKKKLDGELERSSALTNQIEQLNSIRLEAEEALRRERENTANLDAENKRLEREKSVLQTKLQAERERVVEDAAALQDEKARASLLEEEVHSVNMAYDKALRAEQEKIADFNIEKKSFERQNSILEKKIGSMRERFELMSAALQDEKGRIIALKEEMGTMRMAAEESLRVEREKAVAMGNENKDIARERADLLVKLKTESERVLALETALKEEQQRAALLEEASKSARKSAEEALRAEREKLIAFEIANKSLASEKEAFEKQLNAERGRSTILESDIEDVRRKWKEDIDAGWIDHQTKLESEKSSLQKHFDQKSEMFDAKIDELQKEVQALLAEKATYVNEINRSQALVIDLRKEVDVLQAKENNSGKVNNQNNEKIKSLIAQLDLLKDRARDDVARSKEDAEKRYKEREIKLLDSLRGKETSLLEQYKKKREILERSVSEMKERVAALEGERKAYLDQVMTGKNTIEQMAGKLEEYKDKAERAQERSSGSDRKISSLQDQISGLQMQLRNVESEAKRRFAEQLEAEKKRLDEQYGQERAALAEELASSRTQLKLAKENLDGYLKVLKQYEKSSAIPDIDTGMDVDMDYGYDEQPPEIREAGDSVLPLEMPVPGIQEETGFPVGNFSTVGSVSSILLMDSIGRAYIELAPDNVDLVSVGGKLYIVKDGKAAVELRVIDKFLALNSAVAEFSLDNQSFIREKSIVSVLD